MALVGFKVKGGFASVTQSSCRPRGLAVERSDNLSKLQISGWDPGVAGFAVERAIGLGSSFRCVRPTQFTPIVGPACRARLSD